MKEKCSEENIRFAFELLKATKKLFERQNDSYYVLNLLEEEVMYDGVECDGYCLLDDIRYLLEEVGESE